MPTYEYQCTKCGHQFEKFQNMSDEPLKRCPKCRCKVKRLFGTGAGIIFKGSGFYQTDYRSESYQSGVQKEKCEECPAKCPGKEKKTAKKTGTKK